MRAARLAAQYRNRFGEDAVIDVIGFRRYGHNELDEPTFTNPGMYAEVEKLPPPGEAFAARLVGSKQVDAEFIKSVEAAAQERLNAEFNATPVPAMTHLESEWEVRTDFVLLSLLIACAAVCALQYLEQSSNRSGSSKASQRWSLFHFDSRRIFAPQVGLC